jgi:hypothetical protein
MPHLTWVHKCSDRDNLKIWLGEEVCRACGASGEPDGLGLTSIESRGNFQHLNGFPSIGPHLSKLPKYTEICPTCDGNGVCLIHQHNRWVPCKSCQGTGGIITVSEKRFIKIQEEAWAIFDAWSMERGGDSEKCKILERQKRRIYKRIYRRAHYVPKSSKRAIRYFEKNARLISLMIDPENCDLEVIDEWENLKCP